MIPRPYFPLASMKEAAASVGYVRGLSIFSIVVAAVLLSSITYKHAAAPHGVEVEKQKLAQACMQWHQAASMAVSRLVQSTRDTDLRQVNDSIFRMRRARRNCEAGWFELACQDYFAVAANTLGHALSQQLFPCLRVAKSPDERN